MADTKSAVRVEGLSALSRTFGQLSKELRRGFAAELRVIAREVAATAREEAIREGFQKPGESGRGTGKLLGSIRGSVIRGYIAQIRDTALSSRGYSYPKRWEYGGRAFMVPAVERDREAVVAQLEEMLGGVLEID